MLDHASFHRCWDTLFGATSIGSIGNRTVAFYGYAPDGDLNIDLMITSGKHILYNGRVYRLGWSGYSSGIELTQALFRTLSFL